MNKQIDKLLSQAQNVALVGHINPDGDCFGSISAVNYYISQKFKCRVDCFAECQTLAEEFVPFMEHLSFNPTPLSKYDVCICLDTGDLGRLGRYVEVFNNSSYTICIDHHATNNGFAQINIIQTRASNCENVYHLLKNQNFTLDKATAGKLFAGIITDTNNLSTNAVTKDTYITVENLIDFGIDYTRIIHFYMNSNTFPQYNLLAMAMSSVQYYNNNTIMVMRITDEQLAQSGGTQEDLTPIINQAFCMKHAKCALLITPRNGQTHVSFRSRGDVDVSVLAQHFGGGGHKPAAAFTVPTFTKEDLKYIVEELTKQIQKLPQNKENLF